MTETAPEWFAVAQGGLCLGAAWAILAMYLRGTPVRPGEGRGVAPADRGPRDPGLFWLAAAVAVWGASGLLRLPALGLAEHHPIFPLLSCANSSCLLVSAAHLDYGVAAVQRARGHAGWKNAAFALGLIVAMATVALVAAAGAPAADMPTRANDIDVISQSRRAELPDLVLSVGTLVLYGFGLFRSFVRRGFVPLAVLACVAVGLQIVAQVPDVTDALVTIGIGGERRWTLLLVSKALTLVAFLSLGMSWVHEVARRPAADAPPALVFTGEHLALQGRRRYVLRLGAVRLEIRETPHRDLLALAVRRVVDARGSNDGNHGFVALPDLVGRLDDSRIRRLREDLRPAGLDVAIESNFQKAYRLALPPERIAFDRDALARDPELAPLIAPLIEPVGDGGVSPRTAS